MRPRSACPLRAPITPAALGGRGPTHGGARGGTAAATARRRCVLEPWRPDPCRLEDFLCRPLRVRVSSAASNPPPAAGLRDRRRIVSGRRVVRRRGCRLAVAALAVPAPLGLLITRRRSAVALVGRRADRRDDGDGRRRFRAGRRLRGRRAMTTGAAQMRWTTSAPSARSGAPNGSEHAADSPGTWPHSQSRPALLEPNASEQMPLAARVARAKIRRAEVAAVAGIVHGSGEQLDAHAGRAPDSREQVAELVEHGRLDRAARPDRRRSVSVSRSTAAGTRAVQRFSTQSV